MLKILKKSQENRKNGFQFKKSFSRFLVWGMIVLLILPQAVYAKSNLCISTDVGFVEDGRDAIKSFLKEPYGIAIAKDGSVYIADSAHHRIRKIKDGKITTIAGTGTPGYEFGELPALSASLRFPKDVAIDSKGNIYISDSGNNCIRIINSDGIISTYAGSKNNDDSVVGDGDGDGDGGFATFAVLNDPRGIAIDKYDNLYIADMDHHRIRVVYAGTNRIQAFAGCGIQGYDGDGGDALSAKLDSPRGVFADSYGNLWIADTKNHVIRKVDRFSSSILTIAGVGRSAGFGGDGDKAEDAKLDSPSRIFLDNNNNLFISDHGNNRIRKVINGSPAGIITTYAGGGTQKSDNIRATDAYLPGPIGIAFDDESKNLYINSGNLCRKVLNDDSRIINTIAGINDPIITTPKKSTSLNSPNDVFFDSDGSYYIANTNNHSIEKVMTDGTVVRIAGTGEKCDDGSCGNGDYAIYARLNSPQSILKLSNYLYFSEPGLHWIRRIDLNSGIINKFAGNGSPGFPESTKPISETSINFPMGLYNDKDENIYFADKVNHCVFKINTFNINAMKFEKIAGEKEKPGKGDDGIPAENAALNEPTDVWLDERFERVFIADSGNKRVCMIDNEKKLRTVLNSFKSPQGVTGYKNARGKEFLVVTDYECHLVYRIDLNESFPRNSKDFIIAGIYELSGFSGDNGPSLTAKMDRPKGLTARFINGREEILIADMGNDRIRKLCTDCCGPSSNIIKTIAGLFFLNGDPLDTAIREAGGVVTDDEGNLYFSDTGNHRVMKIGMDGSFVAVAGNGTAGFSGDYSDATKAQLRSPHGLDYQDGILYIADSDNHAIRKVEDGIITTLAGDGTPGRYVGKDLFINCLNEPIDIVMLDDILYISDSKNHRIVTLQSNRLVHLAGDTNGTPGFSGDGGDSYYAKLDTPAGLFITDEYLLFADKGNNRIRRIDSDFDTIDTIAGTEHANPFINEVTSPENVNLSAPRDVVEDSNGNVYITNSGHNRIQVIKNEKPKKVYIFAGNDNNDCTNENLNCLSVPSSLAFDSSSNTLFVADGCHRIVGINTSDQTFTRIAGTMKKGFSGDNGPALSSSLDSPYDIATDHLNNIYIADYDNHMIRMVSSETKIMTTIAGTGIPGLSGDNMAATSAQLNSPCGVAVNTAGDVFIADTDNNIIRKINHSDFTIETIAGCSELLDDECSSEDGKFATKVSLSSPRGIAIDSSGNIYVADKGNKTIRKIDSVNGMLINIADSSDGLVEPFDVAISLEQNVFVSDTFLNKVLMISPGKKVSVYAGDGSTDYFYTEEYDKALDASLDNPTFIDLDEKSNLYIADTGHHLIRVVVNEGEDKPIVTIAGDGDAGFSGENGNPLHASLNSPKGISVGTDGNIYISDTKNHLLRKIFFQSYPIDWKIDEELFTFRGEITAIVEDENGYLTAELGDKVAVFIGDECRGIAYAETTEQGKIRFFIPIWGNENDQDKEITLKYFRSSDNSILDVKQIFNFDPDMDFGSIPFPETLELEKQFRCDEIPGLLEIIENLKTQLADCNDDLTACNEDLIDCNEDLIDCNRLVDQALNYTLTLSKGWHDYSSFNVDDSYQITIKGQSQCIGGLFEIKDNNFKSIIESAPVQEATLSPLKGFLLKITPEADKDTCVINVQAKKLN